MKSTCNNTRSAWSDVTSSADREMGKYYLFTWPGYRSGGVINDCAGRFDSIENAKCADPIGEVGVILELRVDGLWIVAEHHGYPAKWLFCERRLEDELVTL